MKDPKFSQMYHTLKTEFRYVKNTVNKDVWRSSVIEALYYFSRDYYNGQNSNLYDVLCRVLKVYTVYTPEKSESKYWPVMHQMMYDHLVNVFK